MSIAEQIKDELGIDLWQAEAAIELIDEGNTIPFIARYRKEKHGSLDDEQLRNLSERLTYIRNLEDKKNTVIASIEEQGLMTDELRKKILEAKTQVVVDDLYRPYRPKRRTRATAAKEKGLEGLADIIRLQATDKDILDEAKAYINEEKEVYTADEAIAGASDIIAEAISDEADYRIEIRRMTKRDGALVSSAKDAEEKSVYENYYDFTEPISRLSGYKVLAINRGEKEKFLTVKINIDPEKIIRYLAKQVIVRNNPKTTPYLMAAIEDSYSRLIAPAVEREIRNELTEMAEDGAISVFGKNLKQLLMQPPIAGKVVLGWDPAFRTGCKLSVVDETGKVLDTTVVYPTEPQNKVAETERVVKSLIRKYNITLISVGNGTASRESEQIIVNMLKDMPGVSYVIVNEAGASVYSASKLATEEFPDFDVGQRSATSIARRIQDPLAELVKIEPKAIGVGQYQHDMPQNRMNDTLSGVVEDCVNSVGVDLNTASHSLLSYVSGINASVAKNIVAYREENGRFTDRKQLLKVAKLGKKAYEQCAGFLRVRDGVNPLDNTAVHPESYEAASSLLSECGFTLADVSNGGAKGIAEKTEEIGLEKISGSLDIGVPTLSDIIGELSKPGRDLRDELPPPLLRSGDVMEIKDLKPGMELVGTVRNVIDFGAFVDIGVHEDGLVHISQLGNRFIKHPLEAVQVGEIVKVRVLDVDVKKGRISLTMRLDEGSEKKPSQKDRPRKKSADRRPKGADITKIRNSSFRIKQK